MSIWRRRLKSATIRGEYRNDVLAPLNTLMSCFTQIIEK